MKRIIATIAITILSISLLPAQSRNAKYDAYITEYSKLAVEAQQKYGIPASITIAQGLLESGAGQSRLAKECKNHFGIKCGSSWYGRSMHMDDDAIGECFRCYSTVKESFKDHSEFLKRQRYAFLFDYEVTDYKSWAHGLRRAGYATDPKYPEKLIGIIELYELYKLDGGKNASADKQQAIDKEEKPKIQSEKSGRPENTDDLFGYIEIRNNNVRCLKLMTDDTYKNIAKRMGISLKMLLYYNDLPRETDLFRGDYVYLATKKSQTNRSIGHYTVKAGDSMHSISQEYGIKLKSLYKLNGLKYGSEAEVGQVLKLHK